MYAIRVCKSAVWRDKAERISERGEQEAPGDTLKDMDITDNTMSIFLIDEKPSTPDGEDDRRLKRILAALAAGRDKIGAVRYLLFPLSVLQNIPIETRQTDGKTKDQAVNTWHLNAQGLTANKTAALVNLLWHNTDAEWGEISHGEMADLVRKAIDSSTIMTRLPENFWGKKG